MSIHLGTLELDPLVASVSENQEEIGGRDARIVTITGVVAGAPNAAAVEERLDAIMAAAAGPDGTAVLSLRPGRRLLVRRRKCKREAAHETPTGAFTLVLAAENPFEESAALISEHWTIIADGDERALETSGNAPTPVRVEMTANGTLIAPTFALGDAALTYDGLLDANDVLVLDSAAACATLNGEDVTPYVSGGWLHLPPDGAEIVYTAAPGSAHAAAVAVSYRDRWW